VAALAGLAGYRDLPPGQGCELGEQAGLVALDGEHVVRTAAGQIVSMTALGVHRVGGDDRTGDLNAVQQDGNIGISFVLAPTSTWARTAP